MKGLVGLDFCFPREYLPGILMVSLLSVGVLVILFAYLNYYTRRYYFAIWTAAWLFYALYLMVSLRELEFTTAPAWVMLKHSCLSAAAVFLLWGSTHFLALPSRQALFGLFLLFLLIWNYVGTAKATSLLQLQAPIFTLIGLASALTGWSFFRRRCQQALLGAGLLASGFTLWGGYLVAYPFVQGSEYLLNAAILISILLQLFIAVSMIVLVLEEARLSKEQALAQVEVQKSRNSVLQAQVASSEMRYRMVVENSLDGILIFDLEAHVLLANYAAADLLEVESGRLEGLNAANFFTGESKRALDEDLSKTKPKASPQTLEAVTAKGRHIWIEAMNRRVRFEHTWVNLVAFRDVTLRKQMEERLRQIQTVEAITQLAGGIAHDFNNILTVILGHVRILLGASNLNPEMVSSLGQIGASAERAAALTRQLLAYSRRQVLRRQRINLNLVIQQIRGRLEQLAQPNVKVAFELEPDLPDFDADPWMLETVLTNLAKNARDAMPGGGHMTLSTRRVTVEPSAVLANPESRPGAAICLRVKDAGRGMDETVMRRIFEPFFTTKEFGKGTGLGLPMVYGIVKQHGGWINVDSTPGQGTVFNVFFPDTSAGDRPSGARPVGSILAAPTADSPAAVGDSSEAATQTVG